MKSPVTKNSDSVFVQEVEESRVIACYREIGMDVSAYVAGKNISIWQCPDTGYRFYYPFDLFGDDKFYEDLQQKNGAYYTVDKFEFDRAMTFLSPSDKVLEIGCGSGRFLEKCRDAGIEAAGLEFNEQAIQTCREKGLQVEGTSIGAFAKLHPAAYDVVCFFQVLEHVTSVHEFLTDALAALKPGGRLIIAVPNNNPFLFRHEVYHALNLPPHHAGLWNKEAFQRLVHYFPIQLEALEVEPLTQYKAWFLAQRAHYKKEKPLVGFLLSLLPRPVYKSLVKWAGKRIEGRNLFVVYRKK